jgi:hypothetical protein
VEFVNKDGSTSRARVLTDLLVSTVANAISATKDYFQDESGSVINPVCLFLADLQSLKDNHHLLFDSNAAFVKREHVLRFPGYWAGSEVNNLALAYGNFLRESSDNGKQQDDLKFNAAPWPAPLLQAGRRVVENLLVPFMLARSTGRLVESSQHYPTTLAKWTNTDESRQLNTSFGAIKAAILGQLAKRKMISSSQVDLYSR